MRAVISRQVSRQARKRRHRHSGGSRALLTGLGALSVALLLAIFGAVAYVLAVADSAPSLSERHALQLGTPSQVFAADGQRLGFIQSDELRSPIGWSEIPAVLRDATVAIEDQRFYKNDGVDFTGIVRAAVRDVSDGQALQGASTITMQLMRNLYLGGDEHTLRQKITEAKLALEYAKRHSKRSILTSYLNSVPYGTLGGQTAIGVQAASRIFFDKPAAQLDLEQAALLAGLPQAPSEYNPFLYPAAARERRDEVLHKMAELHYVTAAQAAAAEHAGLELRRGYFYSERREGFFFEYVRQQLIQRYGHRRVDEGGLKVYTTLNLHMQEEAHAAIAEVLDEPEDPASAIVTLDPHNGDIEAMAESESYEQSQFNLASEGHRQPGSTFKAIDLADALSRGIDPNSTYYVSHTLPKGWLASDPGWEVHTFEGTSLNRSISLVQATLTSDNTVYAQLAADLGEQTITEMAYKMGVKTHLSSYPPESIGGLTLGVTPLEMAVVYATLADGGWRNTPIAITKVVFPNGHVDASWGQPHRVKVLSDGVTAEETDILHQNVLDGTAVRSAIGCPTAAKTGTTSEFVDAWLDGYNPEFATVVWMGYPNRRVSMTDVHGEVQHGGALPAEIWHDYMSAVVGTHCVEFPKPTEPIEYKPFFGKFANSAPTTVTPEPLVGTVSPTPGVKKGTGQAGAQRGQGPAGTGKGGAQAGEPGAGDTPATPEPKAPTPTEPAGGPGTAREPSSPAGAPEASHEPATPTGGPGGGQGPAGGGTAPPG